MTRSAVDRKLLWRRRYSFLRLRTKRATHRPLRRVQPDGAVLNHEALAVRHPAKRDVEAEIAAGQQTGPRSGGEGGGSPHPRRCAAVL